MDPPCARRAPPGAAEWRTGMLNKNKHKIVNFDSNSNNPFCRGEELLNCRAGYRIVCDKADMFQSRVSIEQGTLFWANNQTYLDDYEAEAIIAQHNKMYRKNKKFWDVTTKLFDHVKTNCLFIDAEDLIYSVNDNPTLYIASLIDSNDDY